MTNHDFPELLRNFRAEADRLPHNADAVDSFGRSIQIYIEIAERAGDSDEALSLATVKLHAVQKFDREKRKREGGQR